MTAFTAVDGPAWLHTGVKINASIRTKLHAHLKLSGTNLILMHK